MGTIYQLLLGVKISGHRSPTKYAPQLLTGQPSALAPSRVGICHISTPGTLLARSIASLMREIALFTIPFILHTIRSNIFPTNSVSPFHSHLNAFCTVFFTPFIVFIMKFNPLFTAIFKYSQALVKIPFIASHSKNNKFFNTSPSCVQYSTYAFQKSSHTCFSVSHAPAQSPLNACKIAFMIPISVPSVISINEAIALNIPSVMARIVSQLSTIKRAIVSTIGFKNHQIAVKIS